VPPDRRLVPKHTHPNYRRTGAPTSAPLETPRCARLLANAETDPSSQLSPNEYTCPDFKSPHIAVSSAVAASFVANAVSYGGGVLAHAAGLLG